MAASGERVNYTLRPAKHIERLMICDGLRRLWPWGHLDSYQYIGFGSWYFSDFRLFHRTLGIRSMYSIEREANAERCKFNKPFRHINLLLGDSGDHLPDLDWGPKSIVWLDYDRKLSDSMLTDIDTVVRKAASGSILLVTVNVDIAYTKKDALTYFQTDVDSIKIPAGTTSQSLLGTGMARVSHTIIRNQITESLTNRNLMLKAESTFSFLQLFHFRYADGAKMLTVGGLILSGEDRQAAESCAFHELPFFQEGTTAHVIKVPKMTYREQRHLDQQLPLAENAVLLSPGMSDDDLRDYASVYRYYPTFADADI